MISRDLKGRFVSGYPTPRNIHGRFCKVVKPEPLPPVVEFLTDPVPVATAKKEPTPVSSTYDIVSNEVDRLLLNRSLSKVKTVVKE